MNLIDTHCRLTFDDLAAELNVPIIIHCRKAFDETLEVLDRHGQDVKRVVFHCFSGSAEQAKILLPKGYYFSFTGVVTFNNTEKTRKVVYSPSLTAVP